MWTNRPGVELCPSRVDLHFRTGLTVRVGRHGANPRTFARCDSATCHTMYHLDLACVQHFPNNDACVQHFLSNDARLQHFAYHWVWPTQGAIGERQMWSSW